MNYAQCGEDQNQRTKFGTLVITDISRCLKGHKSKFKLTHREALSLLCSVVKHGGSGESTKEVL